MQTPYKSPILKAKAFNCPTCFAYSNQTWSDLYYKQPYKAGLTVYDLLKMAICSHCRAPIIWMEETMLYPEASTAPMPSLDMPEEVSADFEEARSILTRSPRGAAALLRLCLQKMCIRLGLPGKDINKDIGELVKQGLSPKVQQALDIVRVVGNEAVHPGQMDLKDDVETASQLFGLINFIIEDRITKPKEIEALFSTLPEGKRQGITDRDKPRTE